MSHVAANNEIIRMRPTVRKSRVGVVWKLTKELKLLKNRKHGDEKTLKKCKKKAEKLIKEVKAIKRLKDDDIAKFAILNTRTLQEVLSDPKVDRKTRVMTKLAFHKHLKSSVDKFREKFPNYKLGKRQLAKSELKKTLDIETPLAPINKNKKLLNNDEKLEEKDSDSDDSDEKNELETKTAEKSEEKNDSREENSDGFSEEEEDEEIDVQIQENKMNLEVNKLKTSEIPINKKQDISKSEKMKTDENSSNELNFTDNKRTTSLPKRTKKVKKSRETNNSNSGIVSTEKISGKKIKVVSNEATVKRLKIGESLEESEEAIESKETNSSSSYEKVHLDREIDSFFISSSDGGAYKSVIVPKLNPSMDDDNHDESFSKKKFKSRNSFDQTQKEGNFRGKFDFKKTKRDIHSNESVNEKPTNKRAKFIDKNVDKKIEENLHPSWAAKKKQQEILKNGFQGKKIVFNDD